MLVGDGGATGVAVVVGTSELDRSVCAVVGALVGVDVSGGLVDVVWAGIAVGLLADEGLATVSTDRLLAPETSVRIAKSTPNTAATAEIMTYTSGFPRSRRQRMKNKPAVPRQRAVDTRSASVVTPIRVALRLIDRSDYRGFACTQLV